MRFSERRKLMRSSGLFERKMPPSYSSALKMGGSRFLLNVGNHIRNCTIEYHDLTCKYVGFEVFMAVKINVAFKVAVLPFCTNARKIEAAVSSETPVATYETTPRRSQSYRALRSRASRGKAVDWHLGGALFESQSSHRLSSVMFFVVFISNSTYIV
jgi:hypothetical protein